MNTLRYGVLDSYNEAGGGAPADPWPTTGLLERWSFDQTLVGENGYTWAQNGGSTVYNDDGGGYALYCKNAAWNFTSSTLGSNFNGNSTFSICYWFKRVAGGDTTIPYLHIRNSASTSILRFQHHFPTTDSYNGYRNGTGFDTTYSSFGWGTSWLWVCVTYNGTTYAVYKNNGSALGLGGGSFTQTDSLSGLQEFELSYNDARHDGYTRMLYLYDHVLSSDDKTTLYNSGTPL